MYLDTGHPQIFQTFFIAEAHIFRALTTVSVASTPPYPPGWDASPSQITHSILQISITRRETCLRGIPCDHSIQSPRATESPFLNSQSDNKDKHINKTHYLTSTDDKLHKTPKIASLY